MQLQLGTFVTRALLVLAAAIAVGQASAQNASNRPLTLVVGHPAGSTADTLARLLAQGLAGPLGRPLPVENRPGADGTVAAAAVASAPKDGHTLLFVATGHAASAALYPKLAYDPQKSFAPVALFGVAPVVVLAPLSSPYRQFRDAVAAARQGPGRLSYAAEGRGAAATALAAPFLESEARLDLSASRAQGRAALPALRAGEADLGFDLVASALPLIQSGAVRALAVTGATRSEALRNVPTVAEQGLPGFELAEWFGVLAPAGTPEAVVAWWNKEINDVLGHPEVKDRLRSLGVTPGPYGNAAEFGQRIERESQRYGKAIRKLGIKAE